MKYPQLFFVLLLCACDPGSNLGPGEIPLKIDQRCPGDPQCSARGDDRLYAGAAKRTITPTVEPFTWRYNWPAS